MSKVKWTFSKTILNGILVILSYNSSIFVYVKFETMSFCTLGNLIWCYFLENIFYYKTYLWVFYLMYLNDKRWRDDVIFYDSTMNKVERKSNEHIPLRFYSCMRTRLVSFLSYLCVFVAHFFCVEKEVEVKCLGIEHEKMSTKMNENVENFVSNNSQMSLEINEEKTKNKFLLKWKMTAKKCQIPSFSIFQFESYFRYIEIEASLLQGLARRRLMKWKFSSKKKENF